MSDSLTDFRQRVDEVLAAHLPGRNGSAPVRDAKTIRGLQAALAEAGLAGLTLAPDYGGAGLSNEYQQVFDEVAKRYSFDNRLLAVAVGMVVPTLMYWGTEEQKQRFIPRILRGEQIWCQLFSEPSAGSDLAGLRTRATRDGDAWILNGQKVWTSHADESDYGFCIARTDPDVQKHAGLSAFIVDLRTEGVEVRPIRQITGASDFNEVFLTDVLVPGDRMVGPDGQGWNVALTLLSFERLLFGSQASEVVRGHAERAIAAARAAGVGDDPLVRQELAGLFILERVLLLAAQRVEHALRTGALPGPEGSFMKLGLASLSARSAAVRMRIAGPASIAWDPGAGTRGSDLAHQALDATSLSIAGGTTEIQLNIVGEKVLGLPREPSTTQGLPFSQIPSGG